MHIVCLSGWKQSGKDTLSAYLIEKHGAIRTALADPLKDLVAEEYDIDRTSLDDPNRKESPLLHLPVSPKDGFSRMLAEFMLKELRNINGKQPLKYGYYNGSFVGAFLEKDEPEQLYHTPRSLAILKGSTNRFVKSNFWTEKAFNNIENVLKEGKLAVVSDLRYKSEVAQFQERFKGRAVFVRVNRFKESPSQDPSERDLEDVEFDFYIENTGTLESAYGQMDEILTKL